MAKKLFITVIALMAFQDKIDHKTQYAPGDELQVEKERAEDLVSRGLAKIKEEDPPKAPVDKKPKEEKKGEKPKEEKPFSETPAPGEEKKEESVAPAADNHEAKQDDDTGTEK